MGLVMWSSCTHQKLGTSFLQMNCDHVSVVQTNTIQVDWESVHANPSYYEFVIDVRFDVKFTSMVQKHREIASREELGKGEFARSENLT